VVDYVGEASRVAQNLHRPVTVAHSFVNSNQTLYLMTDASANKYVYINKCSVVDQYINCNCYGLVFQRQWSYLRHA
jgi:hypothetical protein